MCIWDSGKIAAQLEVPPQVLWEKLPGVTQTDVERWRIEADAAMIADARAQATAFGVTDRGDDESL